MLADHPAVAAELARLDAVADAREAAAAEARDAGDDAAVYVEEVAGRARWAADRARALATDASARPVPAKPIPRVHCSRLSLATFRREYVARKEPVVICGLGPHLTEDGERGDGLGWLTRHGANKKVAVTRDNAHVNSTLACADTEILDLGEHLARVLPLDAPNLPEDAEGFGSRDGDGTYLYDCAMPLKLPSLLNAVRVPRYFAHDFLQRTRDVHAFTASWPSLFVAAPHTKSSLHVDQWRGNFWMAMVRGTKRWTLFHDEDVPYLSPDYGRGTLDPAFPRMHVMDAAHASWRRRNANAADDDDDGTNDETPGTNDDETPPRWAEDARPCDSHPLLPYARRWDVDLGSGEVLFVPGGFPHVVHNLDVTCSFAGNFVDESNLDAALRDLKLLGAKYGEQMMRTHDAIDEVWFDPEDEVMVEECLEPRRLVVRYEDYLGGRAGRWGASDWDGIPDEE